MLCFKRWQTFNLDNSPVCHPWTPLRFLWVAKIDEINNKETMCPPMAEISKNDQKYRFLWILCQTIQKRKLLRPHDPSRGFLTLSALVLQQAAFGFLLPSYAQPPFFFYYIRSWSCVNSKRLFMAEKYAPKCAQKNFFWNISRGNFWNFDQNPFLTRDLNPGPPAP